MNMHVKDNKDIENLMKITLTALTCLLSLSTGFVHADESGSVGEKTLIHEANTALSQQDYKTAYTKYAVLAEQGNAVAQFNLGVFYLNGQGVQKNDRQAFFWFHKSAAQGNARALHVIEKEAAQGNTDAQNELAQIPKKTAAFQNQLQQSLAPSAGDKTNTPSLGVQISHSNVAIPTATGNGDDKNSDKSENTVAVSLGFDNTSGNYGTKHESTTTSIPAIISYSTDNYLVALTVPYLEQTGPAGSIVGPHRHVAAGSKTILSEKGLGDVLGDLTGHLIDDEKTGISLDVKTEIKFGTADVIKGLGTGKNDYSLEADLYKDFDKLGISDTLGYTILGSPGKVVVTGVHENIIFNNVFYESLGSTYEISDATKAGLTLYWEQPSEKRTPRQEEITADLNYKINNASKLDFYVLKGLANGSPDTGFGASLKSSF